MKNFFKLSALLLTIIMLLSLTACRTEGEEITTETPESSAAETTAEQTEPAEETNEPLSELYSMEPLVLLRYANKLTREYSSYVKTTEVTVDVEGTGPQSREIVYMKNGEDYSQTSFIEDEMESFLMYSGGKFAVLDAAMGRMGYSTTITHELQYKDLMGEDVDKKSGLIFDFEGIGHFSGGIVSYTDEGFIISIDLSEKGKKEFRGEFGYDPSVSYTIGDVAIVAVLNKEGTIESISLDTEITVKKLGAEAKMKLSTISMLSNINEELTVTTPEGVDFFHFEEYAKFYQFYAAAAYPFTRMYTEGAAGGFSNTLYIDIIENDRATLLLSRETKGGYEADKGINLFIESQYSDRKEIDKYYYYIDKGLTYYVDETEKIDIKPDISGADLLGEFLDRMFFAFVGDYNIESGFNFESVHDGYGYHFNMSDEAKEELVDYYLGLCGINRAECDEIKVASGLNIAIAPSKNERVNRFRIYFNIDIKSGNREYSLQIKEWTDLSVGRAVFSELAGLDGE